MPFVRTPASLILLATMGIGGAAIAQGAAGKMAPPPKAFLAKAGASDRFEISEAKLMVQSQNPGIRSFAKRMIADHTDSTAQVKAAATADGLTPMPPKLMPKQASDLAALQAAKGEARDRLYITQQKAAHEDALALHQAEASSGTTTALKQVSAKIVPVVQSHLDMLNQMPGM